MHMLFVAVVLAAQFSSAHVAVDADGNLAFTPLVGGTVLVLGTDVPTALAAISSRLRSLETALQIAPDPHGPAPPVTAADTLAPRVGQDLQGNMLLIPHPNRTVVFAGLRVPELLSHADQRLATLEDRVFGPGAAPDATYFSVPMAISTLRPGTVGLDAGGNIRIEPLAGKTVLAAGHDVILELHRIRARLNGTETATAACPCLVPPATCHSALTAHGAFACICGLGLTNVGGGSCASTTTSTTSTTSTATTATTASTATTATTASTTTTTSATSATSDTVTTTSTKTSTGTSTSTTTTSSTVNRCANVLCRAKTQCHQVGTCNPATGVCSDPLQPANTPCNDLNSKTYGDKCTSGGSCAGIRGVLEVSNAGSTWTRGVYRSEPSDSRFIYTKINTDDGTDYLRFDKFRVHIYFGSSNRWLLGGGVTDGWAGLYYSPGTSNTAPTSGWVKFTEGTAPIPAIRYL